MLPASSPRCILQLLSPLGTYLCAGHNHYHDIVGRERDILCVRSCSALAHLLLNGAREGQGRLPFPCSMQRSPVLTATSADVCAMSHKHPPTDLSVNLLGEVALSSICHQELDLQ